MVMVAHDVATAEVVTYDVGTGAAVVEVTETTVLWVMVVVVVDQHSMY